MRRLMAVFCFIIVFGTLLYGCNGSGSLSRTVDPLARETAPSLDQLEAVLSSELDRLGIDPVRHPQAAPQGAGNRSFDLSLNVNDPDGTGPNPPVSIELAWTARTIGDYNQDGLVGVSDLTPLGQHFLEEAAYHPAAPYAITHWPLGSPTDDGGVGLGNLPPENCGARSWRRAQIDGNSDGLINVSDITPIGQHWNEHLDGYRVYRQLPGESEFSWLPNPADAGLPYTVRYSSAFPAGSAAPDPHRPLCFTFTDEQLSATQGLYTYYVAPYDAETNAEGPSSPVREADLSAGGGGMTAPLAVLAVDQDHGERPLAVLFDATPSWDPDGNVVRYEWDTDNDPATWEYDSTPDTTMAMTYNTTGTHDQWLRVTDDDGHTATTHLKVAVSDPGGNLPPFAALSGDPAEGLLPLNVTWDAGASTDLDGTIAKYEWDMDGDPTTWEYDSGATPSYQMTYNTGGEHQQYVRITDDGGLTDTAFASVFVGGSGGNQAPTAVLACSTTQGDAPLVVSFDASGSSDPDGNIQQYEWDYDGDSVIDGTTAVAFSSYTYSAPGDYLATVTVTDDGGAADSASEGITAHGWVNVLADNSYPLYRESCSAAVVNGRPAVAYLVYNGMTGYTTVSYKRADDVHGTSWPSSGTYVYDGGAGMHIGHSISMAVVDGNPALGFDDSQTSALFFIRATDQDGSNWPAMPLSVDATGNVSEGHCSLAVVDGHPALSYCYLSFGDLFYVRAQDSVGSTWFAPSSVHDGTDLGWYTTLLEFATTSAFPLIAHYDNFTSQVLFERATDATGTSWQTPAALCGIGDGGNSVSMAIINALPAVAFFGLDQSSVPGLNYLRCTDSTNFNWGTTQQLVTGGDNGLKPCLASIGGKPAVAYKRTVAPNHDALMYIAATDANGSAWGAIETVDATNNVCNYLSLIEVDGRPGIAYRLSNTGPQEIWYAFRY